MQSWEVDPAQMGKDFRNIVTRVGRYYYTRMDTIDVIAYNLDFNPAEQSVAD